MAVARTRRCPICRMMMEEQQALFCIYCRRLMQEAQTELDEWLPDEWNRATRAGSPWVECELVRRYSSEGLFGLSFRAAQPTQPLEPEEEHDQQHDSGKVGDARLVAPTEWQGLRHRSWMVRLQPAEDGTSEGNGQDDEGGFH